MRDQAPTRDARSRIVRELIVGVLALYGFLGSLTSHAERPERLRLIGAVPSGFEQTLQLHFTHFKVDEYTASASHDAVKNTRIRLEQHRGPLPLDLAGTLKHYESTNMARCQAPERTTIFSGLEQNYETTVMLTVCPKRAHLDIGYLRFTKAILADALYFVEIEQQVPHFNPAEAQSLHETVVFWTDLLKQFILCSKNSGNACMRYRKHWRLTRQPTHTSSSQSLQC
ncbi:MAG: hypothetical protein HN530_00600 [Gammaproteobacteria bacterium]|nr:hypothetical protein [Gammaproteobacteria bacterium]